MRLGSTLYGVRARTPLNSELIDSRGDNDFLYKKN